MLILVNKGSRTVVGMHGREGFYNSFQICYRRRMVIDLLISKAQVQKEYVSNHV